MSRRKCNVCGKLKYDSKFKTPTRKLVNLVSTDGTTPYSDI